jgi:methanethiol S-methyltransferase
MIKTHIILALAWIVYCSLHSVFASLWFKQRVAIWMGKDFTYYRFFYSLFATVSFFAIVIYHFSIETKRIFIPGLVLQITGGVLFVAGLVVMALYVFNTGLGWLIKHNKEQKLVQNGIHRYVRHPLYSGTFLLIWGLWLVFPSLGLLIMNIIITTYTLVAIRFEEQKLVSEFGESYLNYKKTTPMIMPRLRFFRN